MALQATVYRFTLEVSHVDRGRYETLELRAACHPSETAAYLLTRVLAYAFLYEEGLAFSRGGLSDPDEPALSIRALDGSLRAWIDIGTPTAERLHKASKAAPRVVVLTHKDPRLLREAVASRAIHRKEALELYAVEPALLAALEAGLAKSNAWALTFTEGVVYVTCGDAVHSGALEPVSLGD